MNPGWNFDNILRIQGSDRSPLILTLDAAQIERPGGDVELKPWAVR